MITVTVTTQAELDEALALQGSISVVIIDSRPGVWLELRDTPLHIVTHGDSWVVTRGESSLAACDRSRIAAFDCSSVAAWGLSHVDVFDQAQASQCSRLAKIVRH